MSLVGPPGGADAIDYCVDGTCDTSGEGAADESLSNVMLQGYNGSAGLAPQTYDIYWNGLSGTQTPEPGTIGTMFVGVGLLMLGMRSRRRAS